MKELLEQTFQERVENPQELLELPNLDVLPSEILDIPEKIPAIIKEINIVEVCTASPESIQTEKSKFFNEFLEGREYNPVFEYPNVSKYTDTIEDARGTLMDLIAELRSYKPEDTDLASRIGRIALYYKLKDSLATCDLIEGMSENNEVKIKQAVNQKYPSVPSLIPVAEQLYDDLLQKKHEEVVSEPLLTTKEQEFLKNTKVNDEQIKEAFEWALDQYGLKKTDENKNGYTVQIDPSATSIDVRDKSQKGRVILINKGRTMDLKTLLELIAHEIEGHARQSTNGIKLFKIGGGNLQIDNEGMYEGLGMRYESSLIKRLYGTESGRSEPYYTYAVQKAEEGGSFYDVFNDQLQRRLKVELGLLKDDEVPSLDTIDPDTLKETMNSSWLKTYRIMRGHTDTSNPEKYALRKDLAYLYGQNIDDHLLHLHKGFLNEAGVIDQRALLLLTRFNLSEHDLPIPFKDVAFTYWTDVLKPQMQEQSPN